MRAYSRGMACLAFAVAAAALVPAVSAVATDEVFAPTAVISLPGGQKIVSFDISFVDPVIGLYILGDRTNQSVDVIDTTTNAVLTQLKGGFVGPTGNNDTSGPDGVVIVGHREVWVGDAPCTGVGHPTPCAPVGSSSVKVIDLFSQQLTHTIFTGGVARSDELCFDPRHHLVLAANNADPTPFATIISTTSYSVLAKIPFNGTNGAPNSNNGAEQCQWDHRTGKFYISIPGIAGQPPGTGGVAVIDPVSMKVEKTFIIPLASCDSPQGMAIGPDHQILLGCNGPGGANHPTAVIDDRNGAVIKTLANESGSDMVWFNPGDGHYFLARSAAVGANQLLGVVDAELPGGGGGEQSGGDIKADPDAITAGKNIAGRNVHSVAADPILNKVFVPIPAGVSTICGSLGGVDANGCIAVFTTPNDDRPDRDHSGRR
ncbi:MAG: hypothetical protein QOD40_3187 [Alphaproteobacteria bacterium]|nr:hypothetical protein [Alphaproteobacteria bacterium]